MKVEIRTSNQLKVNNIKNDDFYIKYYIKPPNYSILLLLKLFLKESFL